MNAKLVFEPEEGLSRLLLRNAFLNLLTLRLYRFWGITNLRRHLWSSLRIEGDVVEYSGHAHELLRGFLATFFILTPVYILICALRETFRYDALLLTIFANITFFGVIALFAIGQYQNRGYLLSHTLWRGLYAGQDGSSIVYAVRYCLWGFAFCITAGLSVPWACEDLARYRIQHSFWGGYKGRFAGKAKQLLLPWLIVWCVHIGPCFAYLVWVVSDADWNVMAILWEGADAYGDRILRGQPYPLEAWVGAVFAGLSSYAIFSPIWLLWYLRNTSIGPIRFSSTIQSHQVRPRYGKGILVLCAVFIAVMLANAFADHDWLYEEFGFRKQTWILLFVAATAWPFCVFVFMRFVSVRVWVEVFSHIVIHDIVEADNAQQALVSRQRAGGGISDAVQVQFV